jgi:plasmid segregation protein ParM
MILVKPAHVSLGMGAVMHSRFNNRRESRNWIETADYHHLFCGALTQHTTATQISVDLVTGLPIAFYGDKGRLAGILTGEHSVQVQGRTAQLFRVNHVRVIPQPFGSLLSVVLDGRGQIVDNDLALSRVGVIDVGGKTTNLLSVHKLTELDRESTSVSAGGWRLVRAVRQWLAANKPGLDEMRDHELAEAIKVQRINYAGEPVSEFPSIVSGYADSLAQEIIATATQLWNGGALLDKILVTGGGALLLGEAIRTRWPRAEIVPSPVYANAIGYHRLAKRLYG